jgi:hypothetical protein
VPTDSHRARALGVVAEHAQGTDWRVLDDAS